MVREPVEKMFEDGTLNISCFGLRELLFFSVNKERGA